MADLRPLPCLGGGRLVEVRLLYIFIYCIFYLKYIYIYMKGMSFGLDKAGGQHCQKPVPIVRVMGIEDKLAAKI